MEKMLDLLDEEPEIKDIEGALPLVSKNKGELVFGIYFVSIISQIF